MCVGSIITSILAKGLGSQSVLKLVSVDCLITHNLPVNQVFFSYVMMIIWSQVNRIYRDIQLAPGFKNKSHLKKGRSKYLKLTLIFRNGLNL